MCGNKAVMKAIKEASENSLTPWKVDIYHKTFKFIYIMFCIRDAKVVT